MLKIPTDLKRIQRKFVINPFSLFSRSQNVYDRCYVVTVTFSAYLRILSKKFTDYCNSKDEEKAFNPALLDRLHAFQLR